jgi:hypothetical protein
MKRFTLVFKDRHCITISEEQASQVMEVWKQGKVKVFELRDGMYAVNHIARICKVKETQNVIDERENEKRLEVSDIKLLTSKPCLKKLEI